MAELDEGGVSVDDSSLCLGSTSGSVINGGLATEGEGTLILASESFKMFVGIRDGGPGRFSSRLIGSSGKDSMYTVREWFTRFAACRTWSDELDIAGNTWDRSLGTNASISSGQISNKVSIHRRAVN